MDYSRREGDGGDITYKSAMPWRRKRALILWLILTFPTIGMAGIAQLPAAQGAGPSPASSSYGYVCRLAVKPQYSNAEDVKVVVVGFYSEGGRYIPKPVHINIIVEYAGVGGIVKQVNTTVNDNKEHTVNLGKFQMATYTITATFQEAKQAKQDNFIVLHEPVPYYLSISRGVEVRFKSLSNNHNDTFTVNIILQYSAEDIEEKTYTNTTNFTYRPPSGVKVMSVYVADRWGNVNGMNNGEPIVWVYTQDKNYYLMRTVAAVVVFIVLLIGIVYVRGRLE